MASDQTPNPEFLGGEKAVISDSRDFALVVMIDHNGVADVQANGISHPQAAQWLRFIADGWDPPGKEADRGQ